MSRTWEPDDYQPPEDDPDPVSDPTHLVPVSDVYLHTSDGWLPVDSPIG